LVSGLLGKVEQELPCGRGGVRVFPSKGEFGGFLGRLSRIVFGVSEGFREEVELRGLGYRGFVATDGLYLDLGDCHWVVIQVPAAVELRFQGRYHVLLQSYDYCVLRNFLDNLERVSRVNVYTGLGLRVGAKPYRVKIGKIREK